jgi:hypothetical protein
MNPVPAISTRPTSERRGAAARANGAKSRGPVTALGKANSSRNSHRHGLRSRTLFANLEYPGQLTVLLASFERTFQPRSEIEHTLIGTMALARSRQSGLRKLETSIINREICRLKSLMPVVPNQDEAPMTLIALAYQSLSDHSCFLHIMNRLESRCERQYDRAVDRLSALRAHGIFEKVNIHGRTQQVIENTSPHSPATRANPDPKNVIIHERSQQTTENTTPPFGTTQQTGASRIEPELTMNAGR